MRRALLALVVALAGCASPYPMDWQRADSSAEDLRREAAQCRVIARSSSAGEPGLVGLAMAEANYRDCMIGKGWTAVK